MPTSCNICSTAFTFFCPKLDGNFIREDRKLVPELFKSGNLIPAVSREPESLDGLLVDKIPPVNVDFFFADFLSTGVPRLPAEVSLSVDVDESACAISF